MHFTVRNMKLEEKNQFLQNRMFLDARINVLNFVKK